MLGCNLAQLPPEMLQSNFWVLYTSLLVQVATNSCCVVFDRRTSPDNQNKLCFFLSADIKGFLNDVKPALISALDTEYEKNPFEVHLCGLP